LFSRPSPADSIGNILSNWIVDKEVRHMQSDLGNALHQLQEGAITRKVPIRSLVYNLLHIRTYIHYQSTANPLFKKLITMKKQTKCKVSDHTQLAMCNSKYLLLALQLEFSSADMDKLVLFR